MGLWCRNWWKTSELYLLSFLMKWKNQKGRGGKGMCLILSWVTGITMAGRHCYVPENLSLLLNVMFNKRTKRFKEFPWKIMTELPWYYTTGVLLQPRIEALRGGEWKVESQPPRQASPEQAPGAPMCASEVAHSPLLFNRPFNLSVSANYYAQTNMIIKF